MNLIERLNIFLKSEEFKNILSIKGYIIVIEKGWYRLLNIETNKEEKLTITTDPNNKNRIRFKGETFAFTLNTNNKGDFYLDHLLIGDVKKEEFDFIMRHNIDKDNNDNFRIKILDNKSIRHIYEISNKSIYIERITTLSREYEYNNENKLTEKNPDKKPNSITQKYKFSRKGDKINLTSNDSKYTEECIKEFHTLEMTYMTITSYIGKRIPFLSLCINEASYCNVTPYEIKRKIATINNGNASSFDQTLATTNDEIEPVEPTKKYTLSRYGKNNFHLIEDKSKKQ